MVPYPFTADDAFLGGGRKRAFTWHAYDGHRLICGLTWRYYVVPMLAGSAAGPLLTGILLFGKLNPKLPWFALPVAIALNVLAWAGWLDALVNRYRVIFEFTAREVQFYLRPASAPKYTLPFSQIADVRVVSFWRARRQSQLMPALSDEWASENPHSLTRCHSLVLTTVDGTRIHLLETTDLPEAVEVERILAKHGLRRDAAQVK
jgi:hypothetical protein